jgi:hypothetical protein
MLAKNGFFDKYWNPKGNFKNKLKTKTMDEDNVIFDRVTDLMWHPSGSQKFVNIKGAELWISNLNEKGYAGFADWRLPTLEEAASLLENKTRKTLYIDPAFDQRQWCIWTGDVLCPGFNWLAVFSGRLDWFDSNVKLAYVRPVRSMQNNINGIH